MSVQKDAGTALMAGRRVFDAKIAGSTASRGARYFSARVGKTASFSPAWNCGPTLASEMLFGKRSSRVISRTRAMKRISQSGTRRRCDSKLATESRLTLHPRSWSLVARVACDQPRLTRHFRTCGPIRFIAGFVTACDGNETPKMSCVHTNTEKACHCPPGRRSIQKCRKFCLSLSIKTSGGRSTSRTWWTWKT
jgi:hypothetical protein